MHILNIHTKHSKYVYISQQLLSAVASILLYLPLPAAFVQQPAPLSAAAVFQPTRSSCLNYDQLQSLQFYISFHRCEMAFSTHVFAHGGGYTSYPSPSKATLPSQFTPEITIRQAKVARHHPLAFNFIPFFHSIM